MDKVQIYTIILSALYVLCLGYSAAKDDGVGFGGHCTSTLALLPIAGRVFGWW